MKRQLHVDLEGGCFAARRGIDLRKLNSNTIRCIEIVEGHHHSYIQIDEEQRYDDYLMDSSG